MKIEKLWATLTILLLLTGCLPPEPIGQGNQFNSGSSSQVKTQSSDTVQKRRIALPFGAYDTAFLKTVEGRWLDLLDNSQFVRRSGRVGLRFRLHSDGRITGLKVDNNDVGDLLGLLCQRAVLDPAPYRVWPADMRKSVPESFRDIALTFYYNGTGHETLVMDDLEPGPVPESVQRAIDAEKRRKERAEKVREDQAKEHAQRITDYLADHPTTPDHIRDCLRQDKVIIGFDSEQLTLVMGKPDRINRTVTQYGTSEQWVYGPETYFFLKNGKLESWHHTETLRH